MYIRETKKIEYPLVYDFVQKAFETARVSDGKEQDFVEALRQSPTYLPELDLVAIEGEAIVGHLMMTLLQYRSDDPSPQMLLLAPLSVREDIRGFGIGAMLMDSGFTRAQELGYRGVLLVGDPGYYGRFGFVPSEEYGIRNTDGIEKDYVMVLPLGEELLSGVGGEISFI